MAPALPPDDIGSLSVDAAPAADADDAPVLAFHQLADAYVEECRVLQQLVMRKQSEVVRKGIAVKARKLLDFD
jgi:hypothetical protein